MILDTLDNADRYNAMHPDFKRVFAFLRSPSLKAVEPGRMEIDGRRLYAIATQLPGKRPDEARLEAHRQYIDVHYLITGKRAWAGRGWPTAGRRNPRTSRKRLSLVFRRPGNVVHHSSGDVCGLFSRRRSCPEVSNGMVQKVVVKVEL